MELRRTCVLTKMLNTLRFCLYNVSRSSCVNYSIYREARMLQKFVDRGLKKKKDVGKSTGKLCEEFDPVNDRGGIPSRRVAMLNKVYVQALMSIMVTGKNSNNLHELGIHITKVRLSNDLKLLSIYFVSSNSKNFTDENLKKILDQTASELQYHITSFRVTGKTPTIRFVKDLAHEGYLHVQNLLLTLKQEEMADPSTDPLADEEQETSESLLEYTQDVLGLDHAKIMGRIQAAKSKSKTFDLSPEQSDRGTVDKLIPFDRKTFEKFYLRRHILAKKIRKLESTPNHSKSFDEYYEIDEDLSEEHDSSDDEAYERFEEDQLNCDEDNTVSGDREKR